MADAETKALKAHRASLDEAALVAGDLKDSLGLKLAAYMLNVRMQTLGDWAAGKAKPTGKNAASLRHLAQTYQLLAQKDDAESVRAWFIGFNPMLSDTAPADVARDGRFRDVYIAAKAFSELS